jgi:uncharacterized protein
MATIKVRGRGTVAVRPDEAVVTFEVASVADAPADAFSATAERAVALDAVLDDAGIDPRDRSTVGIVLQEHQEYDASGTSRRAHRAASVVNARLRDTAALPALIREAVERAEAYIRGPFWRRSDTSEASAEACRLAIVDATRRADAYAAALGLRVGPVERVEDAASPEAVVAGPAFGVQLRAEPPPVHPAEMSVSGVVDVVFELESE